MALIVVFAGPIVPWSSTVASTIRCRVSASDSARFVFRYGRVSATSTERMCQPVLTSQSVAASLYTPVSQMEVLIHECGDCGGHNRQGCPARRRSERRTDARCWCDL